MENIKIGKIVSAVGLRGEVNVYNYSYDNRFDSLDSVIIDGSKVKIQNVRYRKNIVILKLNIANNRNEADILKNKDIYITEEDLPALDQDEFFIKDIIGLKVINAETNAYIGVLEDVLQNGPQDIYSIKKDNGETALIPAVKDFIMDISFTEGIKVKVIPGLIDDED
ncbi:MAG: ribosome maturation factor RimM [Peptostreptococcaceae bacterium]|nr:ribosome maturation factor RimM [Peptostreptococcaceae bacterium]MDY5739208.1 ribosome maturation factor RimM [Anaerovoracaceae bacterium]